MERIMQAKHTDNHMTTTTTTTITTSVSTVMSFNKEQNRIIKKKLRF